MAARVQIIVDAKDNTGGALRNITSSFTEMLSSVNLMQMGMDVLKKGFDFTKQGAQLDFTAVKFDRLARTIGTTGEALSGKLQDATEGTLSKFDAMAMATDLLSLGLTKNEKDTVRLSKVVSGLGMDMNQLVLTLANKTTMRFDQLGVAVDGFDERLEGLKATGMDVNEAFTEAFLQQAEDQLKKVGSAADENIGSFMKMEAAVKNIGDSFKLMAADVLASDLAAFAWQLTHAKEIIEEMQSLIFTERAGGNMLGFIDLQNIQMIAEGRVKTREWADEIDRAAGISREYGVTIEDNTASLQENTNAGKLSEETIKAISAAHASFVGTLGNVDSALEGYQEAQDKANQELAEGKINAEEHAAKMAELASSYEEAKNKIILSIVEMKLATDGWTDAELNAYLRIGQKLGQFSEETVKETQAVLVEAERLTNGMGLLSDNVYHAGERAEDAAASFGGLGNAAQGLAENVSEANGPVGQLKRDLAGLPPSGTSWAYVFDIEVNGRVPRIGGQMLQAPVYQRPGQQTPDRPMQSGGQVFAGNPYTVGEVGGEPFFPSRDGRILSHFESLHALTVGNAMGNRGGGATNYFYGNVYISPDTSAGGDIMDIR